MYESHSRFSPTYRTVDLPFVEARRPKAADPRSKRITACSALAPPCRGLHPHHELLSMCVGAWSRGGNTPYFGEARAYLWASTYLGIPTPRLELDLESLPSLLPPMSHVPM